jgi:hypothetical protein
MRYNNPSQQPISGSVIGNTSDPTAATTAEFAEFWGELAGRFATNEKVIFGLMNEVLISCFLTQNKTHLLTIQSPMIWTLISFSQMTKQLLMPYVQLEQINCKSQDASGICFVLTELQYSCSR